MSQKKNIQTNFKKLELIDFSNKFCLKNIFLFPNLYKIQISFLLQQDTKITEENKTFKNFEKIFCSLYFLFGIKPLLKYKKNEVINKNKLNAETNSLTFKITLSTYKKQLESLLYYFVCNKFEFVLKSLKYDLKWRHFFVYKEMPVISPTHLSDLYILLNNLQIDPNQIDIKIKTQFLFATKNKDLIKYLPFSFI